VIRLRGFAVVVSSVCVASACAIAVGQSSPEPVPQEPAVASDETSPAPSGPGDVQRDPLRAEFVEARTEFARVTAAALTSDELTNWVRGLSQRIRLRRTEEDLWEVRAAIDRLNQSGRTDSDRMQRLIEREAALAGEVEQLRSPSAASPAGGIAMPDQTTARHWIEREMSEETNHLADTLSDREIARRTRRLHRLTNLAQFARGLQQQRRGLQAAPRKDEQVVPAGGATTPADKEKIENADFGDLGQPTTVPPELPKASPEQGTTAPARQDEEKRDQSAEEDGTSTEAPSSQS
jgi:hypothetical protein